MITIGLPVYNCEQELIDTLKSIFSQTYEDWELIAIDDGSTDRSLDILMSINDPRVKVIHDGNNKKLAARLNEINERSSREYILRMDSGDMCSPRRVEAQLDLIKNNDYNIVSSEMAVIDSKNNVLNLRRAPEHPITLENYLRYGSTICHPTILTRASWSKKNLYAIKNKRTEDYELWLRSIAEGVLDDKVHKKLNAPLYFYRDDSNVKTTQLDISFKERNELLKQYSNDILHSNEVSQLMMKNAFKKATLKMLSTLGLYGKFKTQLLKNKQGDLEQLRIVKKELDIIDKTKIPGIN